MELDRIETTLEHVERETSLRSRINRLLGGGRIRIVLQPIHSLATGRAVGAECLARFPDAGNRGPDAWFEEAAEVGLGVELELLAARCALETARLLPPQLFVSVNASPDTILSGALEDVLKSAPAANIVIELTEHQRIESFRTMKRALEPVQRHARVAIDNVGSGHAGLGHLVDLSPDLLKLDMRLIRGIHADPARRALAAALLGFARTIGSQVVAQGIECAGERDALAGLGIEYGQGYHFARPMSATDVARHFAELG